MDRKLYQAEFEYATKELSASITDLQSQLKSKKQDAVLSKKLQGYLARALGQVESFHPSGEDDIGYLEHLPTIAEAKSLLKKADLMTPTTNTETVTKTGGASTPDWRLLQVPKLHLEAFSGDVTKYPEFIATFEAMYAALPVTDLQRLIYLKSHLSGNALVKVQQLQLCNESYALAKEMLAKNYDRKSKLLNALYSKLGNLPKATVITSSLRKTYEDIEEIITALAANQQNVDNNPHLRLQVLSKYPRPVLEKLCVDEDMPLKTIREGIEQHIARTEHVDTCIESTDQILTGIEKREKQNATMAALVAAPRKPVQKTYVTAENTNQPKRSVPTCAFCKENHYSDSCTKYKTTAERKNQLGNACFNCLRIGHSIKDCRFEKPCWHCKQPKRHHTALCPTKYGHTGTLSNAAPAETVEPVKKNETKETRSTLFARRTQGTYLTVTLGCGNGVEGETVRLRAVLDTGSNQTYITERAVSRLSLPVENKKKINVELFGGSVLKDVVMGSTHIELYIPRKGMMVLEAETTPEIAANITNYTVKEFLQHYPQYSHLKFANDDPSLGIDILVGNDYLWELLSPTNVIKVNENAQLIKTNVGHFIVGKPQKNVAASSANLFTLQQATEALWKLDTVGVIDEDIDANREQELALQKFYGAIKFDATKKRYEVAFPFRTEPPLIDSNFMLALGRLKSVYRKYVGNASVFQAYENIFQQQLEKGIIEEVQTNAIESNVHYLPHHPVLAPEKSTKIRIVYDASAKVNKHNHSLNDTMYTGRNLLEDMVSMLLRFRTHAIAIVADIEKAFHQIALTEQHRNYTRFLWVRDSNEEPDLGNIRIFRFAMVPFGVVSSPFLLQATIQHHLRQNEGEFIEQLKTDIYVDNLISGAEDRTRAVELYSESTKLFESCSMNLRLWNSNDKRFKNNLPPQAQDTAENISVLGVRWDTVTDTLHIAPPQDVSNDGRCTPKMVLRKSARFFDPLGIWLPITLRPKLLLQHLRKQNYQWSTELQEKEYETWCEIKADLIKASEHRVKRLISGCGTKIEQQIHVFTDASANAYAAAVYLRTRRDGIVEVELIFAKGRVAPLNKSLTIPKLELMAAYIGAQAVNFVKTAMRFTTVSTHFWIDSKCVLHWIHATKILPLFVENRIKTVKNVRDVTYHYIESSLNVADLPSRTASYDDVLASRWFAGPAFLREEQEDWPPAFDAAIDSAELQEENVTPERLVMLNTREHQWELIERCSTLTKLLRITAQCIKFLSTFDVIRRKNKWQTEADFCRTNVLCGWVRREQQRCYAQIIDNLKKQKNNETVNRWNIELNEDGLLRVKGRMTYEPVPYENKHLVLLPVPSKSKLTKLIILNEHDRIHHAGTAATLTQIRKLFWIPRGRRSVYNTIRICRKCTRYTSRPYRQPQIADYPEFRLRKGSCFQYVGLDQMGPLLVRSRKYYVLLYTCLVTRAVTLELLDNMTNEELEMAFRRIIAKRGSPKYVISDKAVQFTSMEAFRHIVEDPIEWNFIPPHASWAGGAYERLIAITKQSLFRTFHLAYLTDNQLRTILCEIESTLNSRPLTYVYDDVNEYSPLTPNDFIGVKIVSYADQQQQPIRFETNVRKRLIENWGKAVKILDAFWERWRNDYLHYLRERNEKYRFRKNTTTRQPEIGQVVLVREPLTKRNRWPMGRIQQLHTSHDGAVRAATVKTATNGNLSYIQRPVQDLYALEIDDEKDETQSNDQPNDAQPENTQTQQQNSPATGSDVSNAQSLTASIAQQENSEVERRERGNRRDSDEFSLDEVELEIEETVELEDDMFDC